MAAARDSDILLWLHNKLGTSADTWSEGSICSQLNVEVLRNIKDCFVELQTQVKLKLLLSFFHIPKRNVEEWRGELDDILEVAVGDSEPWVTMLAEIMKTYPSTGSLNLDIREPTENQRMTHDLISDMKKLVKKHSELGLLPMECNYLNRNAFLAAAGQQVPLTKHFALKRKPKAAALRMDLLNRSSDAQANVKKNQLPSVPVRSRGAPRKSDMTPMKGIPSRISTSGLRTSGLNTTPLSRPLARTNLNRKDGGIKLLEITESPVVVPQSKKRRKLHETSESKVHETEKSSKETPSTESKNSHNQPTSTPHANATVSQQPTSQAQSQQQQPQQQQQQQQQQPPQTPQTPPTQVQIEPATPDYAAGLTPSNPATPSPAAPSTPIIAVSASPGSTVTLGPLTVRSPLPTASTPSGGRATPIGTPVTITPQRIIVANSQGAGGTQTILYRTVSTTPGGYTHAELVQATPVSIAQGEVVSAPSGQPQYATLQPVQPDMIYTGVNLTTNSLAPNQTTQLIAVTPAAIASNNTSSNNTSNSNSTQVQQPSQVHSTPQPQQQPVQHAQPVQQKRNLSLTKEQMLEAQEMFRTSNKVTRPEKALILGFMAGSRDNPCPHLGNIVTIKLSEREEMVSQPDGSLIKMLAETHFQMNYNSGEWQRIRKYRALPVE
ncbi:UNVERIFIED_CONTAM: hypothetical protein RMT77_012942 [Armadillidium vulgare]|nr:Negative elongation factor A [Armadillidium vulgare]